MGECHRRNWNTLWRLKAAQSETAVLLTGCWHHGKCEVGWQEEHITVSFDVWPDESWLCFEGKTRASWKMILSERQQAECFLQARASGQ